MRHRVKHTATTTTHLLPPYQKLWDLKSGWVTEGVDRIVCVEVEKRGGGREGEREREVERKEEVETATEKSERERQRENHDTHNNCKHLLVFYTLLI
jgi:hypothetical protein